MSKFTISKKIFGEFLALCVLPVKIKDQELYLRVTPNSIKGLVHFNRNVIISAAIKGTYEDWGDIGVDNLPLLVQFVQAASTNESIVVSKTANQLHVESGQTEYISTLRDAKYVTNLPDEEKVKTIMDSTKGGPTIALPSVEIKKLLEYGRLIAAQSVVFNAKDTVVSIEFIGTKESCKTKLPITGVNAHFKVSFGQQFLALLDGLKDYNVTVTLAPTTKVAYLTLDAKDLQYECVAIGLAEPK